MQAVVCLDIAHGKKGSRRATFSIRRSQLLSDDNGIELRRTVLDATDAFRDDEGKPTNNRDLQLRLSDFAFQRLVQEDMGDEDAQISVSCVQLCQFLDEAEECE